MKTILLADDSITIQKVVELTFSDGEYRVLCVANGAQALRKIAESRPDIVLLDVIMPEKNGYEVCEAMKADAATAAIPVLLLTGTFEPFDQRRADAAGADGHLTKPFESHTLVARVEELIAARRSGTLPTRAPAPARVEEPV
ncbi:MAG TPA: response regulator, partial [Candidatus Polarisedimenticolia bacterium]|nr:response regulator [Candidatus Polarisedimenticolia bacterium]